MTAATTPPGYQPLFDPGAATQPFDPDRAYRLGDRSTAAALPYVYDADITLAVNVGLDPADAAGDPGFAPAQDPTPVNPGAGRSVVLIDEIDKADPDVPNDLLVPLGSYQFQVEDGPPVTAAHPPLVIITTNEERELPRAFLRRCVILALAAPDAERLREIAAAHFGALDPQLLDAVQVVYLRIRAQRIDAQEPPPSLAEVRDPLAAGRGVPPPRGRGGAGGGRPGRARGGGARAPRGGAGPPGPPGDPPGPRAGGRRSGGCGTRRPAQPGSTRPTCYRPRSSAPSCPRCAGARRPPALSTSRSWSTGSRGGSRSVACRSPRCRPPGGACRSWWTSGTGCGRSRGTSATWSGRWNAWPGRTASRCSASPGRRWSRPGPGAVRCGPGCRTGHRWRVSRWSCSRTSGPAPCQRTRPPSRRGGRGLRDHQRPPGPNSLAVGPEPPPREPPGRA